MNRTEILAHLKTETDRVVLSIDRLTPNEVSGPSLCVGWSRGHVASHLARNADALLKVATAALTQTPDTMYSSQAERDSQVEQGAHRSAAEQAADVRRTAAALLDAMTRLVDTADEHEAFEVERVPGGPRIRALDTPFMRLREVVFHHVDLDTTPSFSFADVNPDLVETFFTDAVDRLRKAPDAPSIKVRTDEGDVLSIGDGTTYVTGPRAAVLGWLARGSRRGVTFDGPVPTLPFGG